MRDRKYRYLPVLMLLFLMFAALPVGLNAEEDTDMPENSAGAAGLEEQTEPEDLSEAVEYAVYIGDEAELLSDAEEEELYTVMRDGTAYGNMVFMTVDDAEGYKTKDYIEMRYQTDSSLKGTDAVVYLIDMDNRMLWITGYGADQKLVTPDYANLITDNVYKYAKSGEYAKCAIKGFQQINQRLSGGRVSGTLRGVGNLCIAVIIAEILCFVIAYLSSVARKAGEEDILENIERTVNMQNPGITHTGKRRIYDPPSKSSGSSGGNSGGGGGFSGGGGGHGF